MGYKTDELWPAESALRKMRLPSFRLSKKLLRRAALGDEWAIDQIERGCPEWRELLGASSVPDETEVVDILSITRQNIDKSTLVARSKKSKPRKPA